MLDVKRLRILREVVNSGSFSAAADVLYLSQSAVSQQVATLEREVGMKLLERSRDGATATDAGRVLVRHADAAISRLEEAERELAAIAGLEGGEVRIGSFPSASATLLTMAVSKFVERHPRVQVKVTEAEPEETVPRVRAGGLDIALTFDYPSVPAEGERDIDRTLLLTETMYVALPCAHGLAKKPVVRMADLSDEAWLSGSCASSCAEIVMRSCRDAGFEPQISFESNDYQVLQGFVAAGLGVTLLPDLALPTLREDVVVRSITPAAPQRRVWAAARPAGSRAPATDAMLDVLTEVGAGFAEQYARLEAVA